MIEAFRGAQNWMNDPKNQASAIWLNKKLPFTMEDLNIKAILLNEESETHQKKLFDSNCPDDEELRLLPGKVIDASRLRGKLKGMVRPSSVYVGRKPQLHFAIRALGDRTDVTPLLHIKG